jgi:hypothetical protein
MKTKRWNVVLGLALLSLACSDTGPSDPTLERPSFAAAAATDNPSQLRPTRLIAEVNSPIPGGTFVGDVHIKSFSVDEAGQLLVTGILDGVATVNGVATNVKRQDFTTTATLVGGAAAAADGITIQQVECQILFLDLGPLFLDVLGLQVDLSEIVLDITAVAGPGNLLGNLLCAVVNLLNGGLDLQLLSNVLNALLGVINAILQ